MILSDTASAYPRRCIGRATAADLALRAALATRTELMIVGGGGDVMIRETFNCNLLVVELKLQLRQRPLRQVDA